jgi:hypothetical protein
MVHPMVHPPGLLVGSVYVLTLRFRWQSMTLRETKGVESSIRKEAASRQSPSPPLHTSRDLRGVLEWGGITGRQPLPLSHRDRYTRVTPDREN